MTSTEVLIEELIRALSSCAWVLNNKHNTDRPEWHNLADAALNDAHRALALTKEAAR